MNMAQSCEGAKGFIWTGTASEGESLWARWSRFCLLNRPNHMEIQEILPNVPVTRRMFVDWNRDAVCREQAAQMQALLGWSNADFNRGTGAELATATSFAHVMSSDLRYCPACLAEGFHSALYQHWAVTQCGRHGNFLLDRCVHCGQPIGTSFLAAAALPFGCPHCGSVFFSAEAKSPPSTIRRDMPAWRTNLSIAQAKADSMWVPEGDVQGNAHRRRRAECIGLWGTWRPGIERQCRLSDVKEDCDPARLALPLTRAQRDVWTFLHRLYAPWGAEIADLERTMNAKIYWPTEKSQAGISIVAASALQLRSLYDAPSPYRRHRNSALGSSTPEVAFTMHGTPVVYSPEGNAIVYRYEILGLACALLVTAALEPHKVAERWCTAPPREWYCATWRLEYREREWVLRIRPRGSVALLHWLIDRYRDRRVQLLATAGA